MLHSMLNNIWNFNYNGVGHDHKLTSQIGTLEKAPKTVFFQYFFGKWMNFFKISYEGVSNELTPSYKYNEGQNTNKGPAGI